MGKKLAVDAFVSAVMCAVNASHTAELLTDKEMAVALRGMADALDPGVTKIGNELMIETPDSLLVDEEE